MSEATDTTTPVVLSGLSSLFGRKEWGGFLKVIGVKLTNRSAVPVAAVRLGWLIVTEEDRLALKPDSLAQRAAGTTPLFGVRIAGHGAQKADTPVIDFLAEAGPLLKAGRLNGEYVVKVRVVEVEFADGSVWRENERRQQANQSYNPLLTSQTTCENTKCKSTNNDGILDGCTGDPFPGLFCRTNFDSCNPERTQCVCNEYVCENCPDNDGDGTSACDGDCDDNDASKDPLAPENCNNGVDDNCNGLVDRYDTMWCHEDEIGSCSPAEQAYCASMGTTCLRGAGCMTPIIIDARGDGLRLTDVAGGVNFDFNGDGVRERVAWPAPGTDDAWLVLDRNDNGLIDSAQELFGNFTPQPPPPPGQEKNGFLALAEYDRAAQGGNNDGLIDRRDAIFASLRLWQDANHNGMSEPDELHTLPELNLTALDLKYTESKRVDDYGNRLRYRAKVRDGHGAQIGHWAWDVFLLYAL